MQDLRQSQRVEVQCPCEFSGSQITGEGVVINLSTKGCAVESNTRVQRGTFIEVRMLMPEHFFPATVDRAIVLWSSEHKFGMKFIRVRPEEQARLARFVKQGPTRRNGPSASRSLFPPVALRHRGTGVQPARFL